MHDKGVFLMVIRRKLVAPDPLAAKDNPVFERRPRCLQGCKGSLAGGGRPVSARYFSVKW